MDFEKRKRHVTSCIPCHTRKQKCDRQYPCTRCSRRRMPERCTYASSQQRTASTGGPSRKQSGQVRETVVESTSYGDSSNDSGPAVPRIWPTTTTNSTQASSLAEVFGYHGQNETNTMALVNQLICDDHGSKDVAIPNAVAQTVRSILNSMMNRPILDFLVRYFVNQVNWIDQVIHPSCFLNLYQRWWSLDTFTTVADIEFPILFLRICSHASLFLPSPTHAIDSIEGVSFTDIRKSNDSVIQGLTSVCISLDPRGSLTRVQHIILGGLSASFSGRLNVFWESVSCATRVAQQIGLHLDTAVWANELNELEKEIRRRTFCNLYIWDSCLSRRLDRIPFLPDDLKPDIMPHMHLPAGMEIGPDAPDVFTERVLRAQLAQFWRNNGRSRNSDYDSIAAADVYDKFCTHFLRTLPGIFALQPDKQWDELVPSLPLQRQLLHLALYEAISWNFRPTLLQKNTEAPLPHFKQIVTYYNKKALAVASLNVLEGVFRLHTMMGSHHTRFSGIIVPVFEAAVSLICLCEDKDFPRGSEGNGSEVDGSDPLGVGIANLTRAQCLQGGQDAVKFLQNLADVSNIADVGAQTLIRLIPKIDTSHLPSNQHESEDLTSSNDAWNWDVMQDYATGNFQAGVFFEDGGSEFPRSDWNESLRSLTYNFDHEAGPF